MSHQPSQTQVKLSAKVRIMPGSAESNVRLIGNKIQVSRALTPKRLPMTLGSRAATPLNHISMKIKITWIVSPTMIIAKVVSRPRFG